MKKDTKKQAAKNQKRSNGNGSTHEKKVELAPTPAGISALKPVALPPNFAVEVAQIEADLANAQALAGLVTFGPGDKQALVKPRPGCERHIEAMAFAALRYPNLLGTDVDPQAMSDTLDYLRAIVALERAVGVFHKTLGDTSFARLSGLWKEALDVYSILSRKVAAVPDLLTLLAPMSDYLAHAPAAVATTPAPTPVVTAPAPVAQEVQDVIVNINGVPTSKGPPDFRGIDRK